MSKNSKGFPWKTVLSVAMNAFFYLVIIFLLLFAIANIRKKTEADLPNIFGIGFMSVQSDSMNGEEVDSFKKGDMIFVKVLNEKSKANLKIGDIVTWYDQGLRSLNTHRIVDITDDKYITQGDKAALGGKYVIGEDNSSVSYEEILKTEVKAIHTSTWKNAGSKLDFIQSPVGFPLVIVLPAVLILIFEGFLLVRNIIQYNNAKMEEKIQKSKVEDLATLEEERNRIREEILKELKEKEEE